MRQGNLRLCCCCASFSLCPGDESRDLEIGSFTSTSKLEHEREGECDLEDFGECVVCSEGDEKGDEEVDGNSCGRDVVKSKLKAVANSLALGCGDSERPSEK